MIGISRTLINREYSIPLTALTLNRSDMAVNYANSDIISGNGKINISGTGIAQELQDVKKHLANTRNGKYQEVHVRVRQTLESRLNRVFKTKDKPNPKYNFKITVKNYQMGMTSMWNKAKRKFYLISEKSHKQLDVTIPDIINVIKDFTEKAVKSKF